MANRLVVLGFLDVVFTVTTLLIELNFERTALRNILYNHDVPNYRRSCVGNAYFFTVVTFNRLPILTSNASRSILRRAWLEVRERFPFTVEAVGLLPEHLHCIRSLPEEDQDHSLRWKEIKRSFTRGYLEEIGQGSRATTPARRAGKLPSGSAGFGSIRSGMRWI